jgi:hypothetical protein
MTTIAAVILAHNDPPQVRKLVRALSDVPIYLHCDAKTDAVIAGEMLGDLPSRVTVLPRVVTNRASWSLVQAELNGLRAAIDGTRADHIVVCSGADYPLLSVEHIDLALREWRDRSLIWNVPIPYARWDTKRHRDGGLWRFEHHFFTRHDQIIFLNGRFPLRSPLRRQVPPEIHLRASSQWKIYCRRDAVLLLDLVEKRPDLIKFWRSTLVPDESFAASMLASPALTGGEALAPSVVNAWYVDWPRTNADHPKWLESSDLEPLRAARDAPPAMPEDLRMEDVNGPVPSVVHRKFFARKFGTGIDPDVVDRIEAELRQ